MRLYRHSRPLALQEGTVAPDDHPGLFASIREPDGRWTWVRESGEGDDGSSRYVAYEVEGPLSHDAVGVLASLLEPLRGAEVPVFVLSTWRTDWILLRENRAAAAEAAWLAKGFLVVEAALDGAHR